MTCWGEVFESVSTSSLIHFLHLTSAFIRLDTLLTVQRCVCVCFASLSLPEDTGAAVVRAYPQEGRCFVVPRTEGLGDSRASSGQSKTPTVTGSQFTTGPAARARGWSPGSRDVLLCLGRSLSQGRGRDGSTAGVRVRCVWV